VTLSVEVAVSTHQVIPSTSVRDLEIFVDTDLVMQTHSSSDCVEVLHHAASALQYLPVGADLNSTDTRRQPDNESP